MKKAEERNARAMGVDRAIEGDLRMGCDPKLKDFPYELNAGFLVDIARRAGQAIMEVYEGHEQDWGVQVRQNKPLRTLPSLTLRRHDRHDLTLTTSTCVSLCCSARGTTLL